MACIEVGLTLQSFIDFTFHRQTLSDPFRPTERARTDCGWHASDRIANRRPSRPQIRIDRQELELGISARLAGSADGMGTIAHCKDGVETCTVRTEIRLRSFGHLFELPSRRLTATPTSSVYRMRRRSATAPTSDRLAIGTRCRKAGSCGGADDELSCARCVLFDRVRTSTGLRGPVGPVDQEGKCWESWPFGSTGPTGRVAARRRYSPHRLPSVAPGSPFPAIFSSGFIRFPVSEHFGADGAEFYLGSAFGVGVAGAWRGFGSVYVPPYSIMTAPRPAVNSVPRRPDTRPRNTPQ
jgi:hypothetical protein